MKKQRKTRFEFRNAQKYIQKFPLIWEKVIKFSAFMLVINVSMICVLLFAADGFLAQKSRQTQQHITVESAADLKKPIWLSNARYKTPTHNWVSRIFVERCFSCFIRRNLTAVAEGQKEEIFMGRSMYKLWY